MGGGMWWRLSGRGVIALRQPQPVLHAGGRLRQGTYGGV